MSNNEIWELISKKIAGEATDEELQLLQTLSEDNPEIQEFIYLLMAAASTDIQTGKQVAEKAFLRHQQRLTEKQLQENILTVKRTERTRKMLSMLLGSGVIGNYVKVIYRNLVRQKSFSFINVSGLAIGMASAILIFLWIQNEMSMDMFHAKKDRIFVAMNLAVVEGKLEAWAATPSPMAAALKADYPQVEDVTRINGIGGIVLSVGDKHLEGKGLMVDSGFLNIFSYPLLRGDVQRALSNPRSLLVTETFARKLFGNEDAMGKMVRIDSNANFMVSGVLKDLPNNTGLHFEYLIPFSYKKEVGWDDSRWDNNSSHMFILLKPGVTEQAGNIAFRDIIKKHLSTAKNEVFLHPLTKWNLYSNYENGKISGGQIDNVRLFGIIGAFILLIACINYMNLSTAKSVKRAKEVGIRKVVGAERFSIILRFIGESIIISGIAAILALVIAELGISGFNWLTFKQLTIPYSDARFWILFFAFILFTGIVAGSYPAFYLSTFKPISVLKGTFTTAGKLVTLRKVLVVVQFSFAICFIICSIVIFQQIKYGSKRDPGYKRDHLAFVYAKGDVNKKYHLIKKELLEKGIATAVTRSNSPISYIWNGDNEYSWKGKDPNLKRFFAEFYTDNDFVETMGLQLTNGRSINTQLFPTDTTAAIINESAAKLMGFKNPIGQIIHNSQGRWTIVGVVRDFVPESPFYTVDPTILQGPKNGFGAFTMRLANTASLAGNMKKVEEIFRKYNPEYPFISGFVDEADAAKFDDVKKTAIQAELFGGLAILISCLGLFALAAYTAESRIKEIGVRKVLGASVASIATLLSKDFLKLVLVSFAIASPVAWWCMHAWLQKYPYRINISWWIFALTGAVSLLIAMASVTYQSIKAALANPVKSLKTE